MFATRMHMCACHKDKAERLLHVIDAKAKSKTGVSIFHMLSLGAILASVALFVTGRKMAAIFIGLWPPTFQALKAAGEHH